MPENREAADFADVLTPDPITDAALDIANNIRAKFANIDEYHDFIGSVQERLLALSPAAPVEGEAAALADIESDVDLIDGGLAILAMALRNGDPDAELLFRVTDLRADLTVLGRKLAALRARPAAAPAGGVTPVADLMRLADAYAYAEARYRVALSDDNSTASEKDDAETDRARAALSAALAGMAGGAPKGWKLVPEKPTREMCNAFDVGQGKAWEANHDEDDPLVYFEHGWAAMLAAAPEPAPDREGGAE